jgi:hypothetical protein
MGNLPNFVCRFQSIHHWHDEVEQYDGQRAQDEFQHGCWGLEQSVKLETVF